MMTMWSAPVLDRVFDEVLRSALSKEAGGSSFRVAADVRETHHAYTFHLDVPGVKNEDLDITLTKGVLTIRGLRRFEAGRDEKVTIGRPYGRFAASYALPDGIETDKLTADLAEGVLSIRIPKQPKSQPRKIPIGSTDRTHLNE